MRILFFLLLTSTLSFSQTLEVNLNSAIELALQNNKKQKISKLALKIAEAQYHQALSANYPILDINIVGVREKEDRVFEMRGTFDFYPELIGAPLGSPAINLPIEVNTKVTGRDTVYGSIDVLYPLFTGGKISAKIKQAKLNKLISKMSVVRKKQEVIFDIKKYFYGYVFANELYKIANQTLNNMELISSITKDFYENGDSLNVKKTDYLNIQLLVSLVKSTVAKIEANRDIVKSALINTIGLAWNRDLKINYTNKEVNNKSFSLNELISKSYESNFDISKLKIAVKISDSKIDEAKSGYYPDVALRGSVTRLYNSYEYGLLNENQENMWNIGVYASMNLFNAGRTTNNVKVQKFLKSKMLVLDEMLKEAVALKIKNELTKAKISYKQIQLLKSSKKLAKQNTKLNIRGYRIDAIRPEKVIEAQYIEAYIKADYLKYLYDYRLSLAKIDRLVGQEVSSED